MKKTVSQETRTHAIAVVASIIAAGSDVGNTQLLLTEATKVDTASAAIRVMSDFHDDIEALTDGMNVLHAIIMNNAARTILVEKEGTNGIKDAINAVVLAMGTHITQPGKNDSIQTCGQEIVNVLSGHLQEELRTPEPPSPVACSQQQQEQQESPMETPDPKGLLETTEPEVLSPASSVPYSDDQFDEEEDKDHEEKEGREGDEQGRALEATRKQKQTSTSPISPIDFKRKVSPNGISSVVSRSNNVSPVISLDYLEHNLSPGFGIQPKRDTVISSQTSPQLPASHLQIENRKLEAKLEKLKLKMQKSTRENKDREEALLDENRKLQSALDQLRGQLDSAEGDVSSALEVENRELRASIEYLNKQSELHRAAESDSQSKMLRLEQELETCRNHIATVSQLEGRNKELEQATSRLQTELEHRGGDKNMAQELELGRRENEKLEQRVQLLIAEKIELSALKQTLSKERTERATLEGELAALRLDKQHSDGTFMELEHATGRVTQLEEELQKLTHSLKIAREEGLSFRDKKVQLEKQLQASELEAGQAFQKAEALQSKVEDLQVQLDKRTIQVEDVQQRLDTQQAYKCEGQKALQRKVQDLELHIVQEKQHMTQQHDRKVDLIKRQLDTEYKMVIKSMTASRSRLEAKLESIELENARYKSKISELSHELEQSQIVSVIQQVPAALPRTNHPPIPPTTLVPKKQPAVTCSRSKAVDDCPFMAKFRILFNLLKPRGDPVETVSYPSMYRFVEKCQLVSPTNARANLNVIFACLNKKRKGRLDFDNFVAVLRHLAKGLGPCGDDYTLFQHAPLRELVDSPVRVDAPCRKETCPLWDREKRTLGHVFSAYVKRGSDGLSFQGFLQLATDFKIVPCLFSRNQLRVKFVEYTQQVGAPCAVLPYDSWISLLQDIAIHKFPNQSNHTKVALLLQWMDSSGGKAKLHQRDRSALLIRKFNHNN
uniref:EF-hand domain-containing protein n=1 Tax=Mucochytrium quahogii TaxID=96639 RepID=A0A7S2RN22_9STRA